MKGHDSGSRGPGEPMAVSRRLDFGIAAGMPLALAVLVLIKGDPLYMGLGYYLAVFLVLLVLGAALRTRPLFLTGASLALSFTFLAYMAVNMLADRPEGLLGLGHIWRTDRNPGGGCAALAMARGRFRHGVCHRFRGTRRGLPGQPVAGLPDAHVVRSLVSGHRVIRPGASDHPCIGGM